MKTRVLFSLLLLSAASAFASDDAQITFTATNSDGNATQLWRVQARPGAPPENLNPRLDVLALFPGQHFGPITVSPDGLWYVFYSERFQQDGYKALTIARSDFSSVQIINVNGTTIHGDGGQAQILTGGDVVVFPATGGPHTLDLYVIRRQQGTNWFAPTLLTVQTGYDWHYSPVVSPDQTRVAFEMALDSDPYTGVAIGEANLDGTGFHLLVTKTNFPASPWPSKEAHIPAYAPDGSLVFEADWSDVNGNNERIWRLPVNGQPALITTTFGDDNSPVVLPDGRIASLLLGSDAPGGPDRHRIKVMDANGTNPVLMTSGDSPFGEVDDIGMGAGMLWAPILSARLSGSGVEVSWPARFTNVTLQASTSLSTGWVSLNAGTNSLTISATNTVRFFRLAH